MKTKTESKIKVENTLEEPARNLIGHIAEEAVTNLANQVITTAVESAKQAIDGKHFMRRLSK